MQASSLGAGMEVSKGDLLQAQIAGLQALGQSSESLQVETGIPHIGFRLHTEEFLIPMAPVREIIMLPTITFVPRSDVMVEGIFALRGEIMPVYNLRRLMGLPRGKPESSTRLVIVECEAGGFGLIVDAITEFLSLPEKGAESLDQNFFGSQYPFIAGVSKAGDKMRGIFDVNRLFALFSHVSVEASEASSA